MGFDERRVLPSLRLLPYDQLVLVAGRDTVRSAGFRRIRALEPDLEAIRVNPFDLAGCLDAMRQAIRAAASRGPVRISATGGTKILTMAGIFAAFEEGVEAWYCDPEPIRFPILRGVRLIEGFATAEQMLIRLLRRRHRVDRLVSAVMARGIPRRSVLGAVRSLEKKGLITAELDAGRAFVSPTPRFELLRAHLQVPPRKA